MITVRLIRCHVTVIADMPVKGWKVITVRESVIKQLEKVRSMNGLRSLAEAVEYLVEKELRPKVKENKMEVRM